ncbi:MAG TPA: 6-phosphogluconolactonase [Casimicrobiaceae bacterium]|nr:6-phosphogluconolactonase [Casimicrobiaceae bacterium]
MMPAFGTLRVFDDAHALARDGARLVCEQAEAKSGGVALCLSGGSTPRPLYEALASPPLLERFPWSRTQFFFGDERFVPPDDAASNARMANDAMFSRASVPPQNVHAIPTVGITPAQAAEEYERTLRALHGGRAPTSEAPLFDVCLLGVGDDGHTASLLPGDAALDVRDRWVAVVAHGRPQARITLTYPALESSRLVVFLLQGEGKRAILDRLLSGDDTLPAGRLRPVGDVFWFVDRAAAGRWT